jgi:hypothetical protein
MNERVSLAEVGMFVRCVGTFLVESPTIYTSESGTNVLLYFLQAKKQVENPCSI